MEIVADKETIAYLQSENESLIAQIESIKQEIQNQHQFNTQTLNESNTKVEQKTNSRIAPRLFCDICDEFDLHDTEDCPQQNMQQDDDRALHSNYNSVKQSNRAYCDLCESFGHEEADCKGTQKAVSDDEF